MNKKAVTIKKVVTQVVKHFVLVTPYSGYAKRGCASDLAADASKFVGRYPSGNHLAWFPTFSEIQAIIPGANIINWPAPLASSPPGLPIYTTVICDQKKNVYVVYSTKAEVLAHTTEEAKHDNRPTGFWPVQ